MQKYKKKLILYKKSVLVLLIFKFQHKNGPCNRKGFMYYSMYFKHIISLNYNETVLIRLCGIVLAVIPLFVRCSVVVQSLFSQTLNND